MPVDRPHVPPTFFRPCWYEAIDGRVRFPDEVGAGTPDIGKPLRTYAREWQAAPGEYDLPGLAAIEGTAEEWANGTLYSKFLAGGYGPMRDCVQAMSTMILSDTDALTSVGGRSEGITVVFSDQDVADAQTTTGGNVPSVFTDTDRADSLQATGGTVSVDIADVDSLESAVETGGSLAFDVADQDSEAGGYQTGGTVAAESADADSMDATGTVSVPVGPGATCATAGAMSLGSSYTVTVPAMGQHWWTFPATAGTTYRVRYVRNSGSAITAATLLKGSCPTPSIVGSLSISGCNSFTAASGEAGFVRVDGDPGGSTNYTITPDAGNCP